MIIPLQLEKESSRELTVFLKSSDAAAREKIVMWNSSNITKHFRWHYFCGTCAFNLIEIMIKNKKAYLLFSGTRLRHCISHVFFFSQAAQWRIRKISMHSITLIATRNQEVLFWSHMFFLKYLIKSPPQFGEFPDTGKFFLVLKFFLFPCIL